MADNKQGVNFCIINSRGEILLQQRDENCPYYPGAWVIPGGAREDNEVYVDTVIREVNEEYNLKITADDCEKLMDRQWKNNPGEIYMVRLPGEEHAVCNEGAAMQWVPLRMLSEQELGFHHNDIVEAIQDYYLDHKEWFYEPDSELKSEWKIPIK